MKKKWVPRERKSRPWLLAGFLAVFLAGVLSWAVGTRVLAAPPSQSPEEGQKVFAAKCAACHTIGRGDLVGPDLKGVADRREREWLRRWLSAPDQMLAQKDPIATDLLKRYKNLPMPNQGLAETEVTTLLAYLETLGGGAPVQQTTQASTAQLPAGDSARGKNLYTGVTRFRNGGPPCMSCHAIGGIGALGGGKLGPDLTGTYARYGEAGVASILETFPFPVMNPVWRDRPLTPEERADVLAFMQGAAVAERPAQAVGWLVAIAVGGAAVLLALAHVFWRRRLRNVRESIAAPRSPRTTAGPSGGK